VGGLAVLDHCVVLKFCEREYADIDLIGLSRQTDGIEKLFKELGYTENKSIRITTSFNQMQFFKKNVDNHIDVFLDILRMEHNIDLRMRLHIEEYTISISDILATKLQILELNEKDVRDILSIVKDLPLGETDTSGMINLNYIGQLCSRDWGLCKDVLSNIDKCIGMITTYDLTSEEVEEVKGKMLEIKEKIVKYPKTLRWRLRAIIGERIAWHNVVEEQGLTKATTWRKNDGEIISGIKSFYTTQIFLL
jgi:hypothetical protein